MTTMSMGVTSPDVVASGRRRVRWADGAAVVWVIAYTVLLGWMFVPALSEPDDNGYFAQGSLLAETGRTWFTAESDAQYVGMHWLLTPDGKYVSRYPPGLAVLIAGVEKVAGWRGAAAVNPVMAVLGVAGFYLVARRVVGGWWAVAAAVVLGMMPEYVHHGVGFDSHTGVAFCVIWGVYFLLRWRDEGRVWQAFLAGMVLGCIPTIRYPDAVMGLGVGLFLLMAGYKQWRHVVAALAGAAIPVGMLAVRNQLVMGAFWRTGYALTHEQTGFGWVYFREHAIDYIRTLNSSGVGPVFALGVVGMVWMICAGGRWRRLGVMLAGMTVPMVLLYMAYYWGPGGGGMGGGAMTMRFLVPTFAAFVLAGVWMLGQVTAGAKAGAKAAVGVALVGLQLLWGVSDVLQQAERSRTTREGLVMVTKVLERIAPEGSVVVGNNGLLQHLDYVRRWKLADASLVQGGGFGGGGPGGMMRRFMGGPGGPPGGEDGPSPRQAEKDEMRRAKYAGSQERKEEKFAADVKRWAGGKKVYFVGGEEEMREMGEMRVLERVKLPSSPAVPMRGGFGGGPGGPMRFGRGPGGGGPRGGPPGGGIMGGFGGLSVVVIAEWMKT